MEELGRDDERITVSATDADLRLLVGVLNEALNGAYAIPEDEWAPLVGRPPEDAERLLASLGAIIEP